MSSVKQSSKPDRAEWDSITGESEFQQQLKAQGKTLEDFEEQIEECRNIHKLEDYNAPKSTSDSGGVTLPDGRALPRFNGASSKWLRLTAQDRAIVTSLAQLANEDLSVHLYNVHILQKKTIIRSNNIANEAEQRNVVWPPRSWTRWPMKPEDVPRRQFKQTLESDKDEDILRSLQASRGAVEDLQETIVATFLKQANERFHRRNATAQSSKSDSTLLNGDDSEDSITSATPESTDSEGDTSTASSYSSKSQSEGTEMTHSDARSPKRKRRNSSSAQTFMDMPSQGQQPIPMADDDKATVLLAPIARHMLSNVDKLLAGLHHQRQAYITTTIIDSGSTVGDTDTDDASPDTSSTSVPTSPSKRLRRDSLSLPQSPAKRIKSTRLHSSSRRLSRTTSRPSIRSPTSTNSQRKRTSRLGARDWGDIMGIASLAGDFQQRVIERASARCASLFGECVSFRTLGTERTRKGKRETDILPDGIRESVPQEKQGKIKNSKSNENIRCRARGLFCQVKGCKRNTQAFSRIWNLNKHMKEMHGIPTPKEMELLRKDTSIAIGNKDAVLDDYEAENSGGQIEGGVHVDGYLQEIRGRPGWSRFWSKTRPRGEYSKNRRKLGSRDNQLREQGKKLQLDGAGETEESDEKLTEEEGSTEHNQRDSSPTSD